MHAFAGGPALEQKASLVFFTNVVRNESFDMICYVAMVCSMSKPTILRETLKSRPEPGLCGTSTLNPCLVLIFIQTSYNVDCSNFVLSQSLLMWLLLLHSC